MRLKSRPATAKDIERFFGRQSPRSIRAYVAESGGDVVGVAGYYLDGGVAVVFSDVKNMPKAAIWRMAREFMAQLRIPATCVGSEKSSRFLERLGWQYQGPSPDGEVFFWLPKNIMEASDV